MITLYLLRHGETVENATGYFQGQTPGHLSARGIAQAEEARARVAALDFDVVLCSDLARTRHTASIVLRGTPWADTGRIIYTPLLRERDMGDLTGLTIADHPIDATVENEAQCRARARKFIEMVQKAHPGQRLLVVSHGYFLRVLQAEAEGCGFHDTARITNCELRKVEIAE